MYILARVDRSILLNTVLLFAFFSVIVWVNNNYIYHLYDYMGSAKKTVDFGLYPYLMVLALICALLCGGAIRRPGDLLVTLLVVIIVPHSLVLNGANQYSPDAQPWAGVPLAIAFGILIIGIVNKIPSARCIAARKPRTANVSATVSTQHSSACVYFL